MTPSTSTVRQVGRVAHVQLGLQLLGPGGEQCD